MAPRRCLRCGRAVAPDARYPVPPAGPVRCPRCFFTRLAARHASGPADWARLRALFDAQGGRCAYTREPLVLGGNATLDHRQPKARGGTGRVDNLQWVTARVNDLKRDLTHAEFLALCRKVTECSGRPPDS